MFKEPLRHGSAHENTGTERTTTLEDTRQYLQGTGETRWVYEITMHDLVYGSDHDGRSIKVPTLCVYERVGVVRRLFLCHLY